MKSCVSWFLCRVLGTRTILLAIWIARDSPVKDFWLALKAWLGILGEFGCVLYANHVRLLHPLKKVIITESTRELLFYKLTGVHNCAWLPLRPYSPLKQTESPSKNILPSEYFLPTLSYKNVIMKRRHQLPYSKISSGNLYVV